MIILKNKILFQPYSPILYWGYEYLRTATKGIVFTIVSALIYGFTPILARIAYDGGSNGVTMTFLRAALSLPVMGIIMKAMRISFALTRGQLRDLMLAVGLGSTSTTILLYVSYSYIPVGMATTLHFIYPVLVSLGCVFFFREKLRASTMLALITSTAGVFLTAGKLQIDASTTGIVLSVLSGFTFAYYVVCLDKSELRKLHYFKLSFYTCVVVAIVSGLYGTFTGTLTFELTPKAWLYSWIVSLFVSVGAVTLLQLGIKYTGAATASILSTFEPITSVLLGVLILGETLSLSKAAGVSCIIASVLVITLAAAKTPAASLENERLAA